MRYVKPFSQLNKSDVNVAGGKGASLGEMTQAGIPVPPGFVVLVDAFEKYLSENNLEAEIKTQLSKVKQHELESVERVSADIQSLIINGQIPDDIQQEILKSFKALNTEFVAVRSSATAEDAVDTSWAGELESYLNTPEDQLLNNVKKCWASLFTPRAIFYRLEKGLRDASVSVAVVVQQMVESEISGIAFSVHPVTKDPNQLVIEAGYGLGEAIVSGSITPDNYVVSKQNGQITDTYLAEQERMLKRHPGGQGNEWAEVESNKRSMQKLTEEQINDLAKLVMQIEAHYGFPCDIEWAYQTRRFFIVQSRPITTLSK